MAGLHEHDIDTSALYSHGLDSVDPYLLVKNELFLHAAESFLKKKNAINQLNAGICYLLDGNKDILLKKIHTLSHSRISQLMHCLALAYINDDPEMFVFICKKHDKIWTNWQVTQLRIIMTVMKY